MKQETIKRIHRYYSWFLAVMIGIVGTFLVLSCLDIYAAGPRSYSPETISQHFTRISIPIYLGIIGILGGLVLDLLLPIKHRQAKAIRCPEEQMLRLRNQTGSAPVIKEVRFRIAVRTVTIVIFVALMVYPTIYFLDPTHFTVSNLNHDIVKAVLIVLVPVLIGLTFCWVCRLLLNSSLKREINIYKQAAASGQKSAANRIPAEKDYNKLYLGIRIALLISAFVLIVLGICNGGAEDVLKKAIAICTECIGLG